MANIQHESEEKLIDFDAIESGIRDLERDLQNSIERTHEEFGAFWMSDSPVHSDPSDLSDISNSGDDFISGWQTKLTPTQTHVTNEDIYNAIRSMHDDVKELRYVFERVNKILTMVKNIHTALGIPENLEST